MKQKEFSAKIIVNEQNELCLGFVLGFYKKGKDEIIQQGVPESVRKQLAKRMNAKVLATVPSQTDQVKS
jgi:hypothetical protein